MAIPFAIPNQEVSQPNPNLEELLRELCDILQRLLILYQSPANNNNNNSQASRNRATTATSANRRTVASDHDGIPELVTNLSLLSAAFNTRTEPGAPISIPNVCTSSRLRLRQRIVSESSCCEETKNEERPPSAADEPPNQEWLQVGVELRKIADDFKSTGYKDEENVQSKASSSSSSSSRQDSLFSKFVPAPFTGSICTAVICVVGWHLLRNR